MPYWSRTRSAQPGRPRRWSLVAIALVGLGLVVAPAIFRMWDRALKGAAMVDNFAPYMTSSKLDAYDRDIAKIDAAVREGEDPRFGGSSPQFAAFRERWKTIDKDMSELLTTIRGNVGNYEAVAALPRFTLFPWFFVIPGGLLLVLALGALVRPGWWRPIRWLVVAVGLGLVLAPAAFQMWDRAPKGGHMIEAFRPIETRQKVETIQHYFGDIVVGQGAVRLQLLTGLERSGLSRAEIAERFPALVAFERDWPAILSDLTPLIATMSDNVGNYDAVAALPPFPLFPWFFLLPGLLVVGLSLVPSRTPRSDHMTRPSRRAAVAGAAALVAVAALAAPAGAGAAKPKATKLVGTFKLDPGSVKNGEAAGTYFRMIFADGKTFFANPDSEADDKTFTFLKPGKKGGLVTGRYQPSPAAAFDGAGNAKANSIVLPQKFAGILFSIATLSKDPQSKKKAALPSITATGTKLSGDTSAWTAEWNKLFFNQGSPKPSAGTGDGTTAVTGNYSAKTGKFILRWRSKIQGGAFDGFIGFWHLQGTFKPS
jgi:hypothetical protein